MASILDTLTPYDNASIYPNEKCLSSSQVLRYEKDPKTFYVEYVLGMGCEQNKPMLVGAIFSEAHRNREFDYRTALAEAGAIKRYADIFERALKILPVVPSEIPLIAEHNGWKVRATLDGFIEEHGTIIENKTGNAEWTQERVNFDDQITLQAWCYWKINGIAPRKIYLNWLDLRPYQTEVLKTFKTSRTVRALKQFEKRVDAVIANIEAENFTSPIYS